MSSLIPVTINNRITYVRPNATVLQACESAGVDVPRFCYHEKLSVAGNCRRCLVEVQKSPKPVVSCARPVSKGRVLWTDTPLVRKAREAVLEFLLLNHPLDCPICDQGGECDLQDEAVTYGSDRGRYFEFKRSVEDKECGPIVKTIRTRCIHCTRCIRFSSEVAGLEVRGSFGRGEETEIGTYIQSFLQTELSGNLVDLCPVGALTSKPYAYQARSWELANGRTETVDFFDALCSDIVVETRKRSSVQKKNTFQSEEILRVLPRSNGLYGDNWISDRTRYAFDGLKPTSGGRTLHPTNFYSGKKRRSDWTRALISLFPRLESNETKNEGTSFLLGSQLNLETLYTTVTFAKRRGHSVGSVTSGRNHIEASLTTATPFFLSLNTSRISRQSISAAFRIGTNPRFETSVLGTRLRREQRRRGIPYASVGAFAPFRLRHTHQGASLRTLLALLENRLPLVAKTWVSSPKRTLLLGVESLRSSSGVVLESLTHQIASRFRTKTASEDRFGILHASVGSLAGALLGLAKAKKSTFTGLTHLFAIQHGGVSRHLNQIVSSQQKGNCVQLSTHENTSTFTKFKAFSQKLSRNDSIPSKKGNERILPRTSLYEQSGHLVALDGVGGRLREHKKVITPAGESRSLSVFWSTFVRRHGLSFWREWSESLRSLDFEIPSRSLLERSQAVFPLNAFAHFETEGRVILSASLFVPTVRNFYLSDPISAQSPTRGECSLFLRGDSSFTRERLFFLFF